MRAALCALALCALAGRAAHAAQVDFSVSPRETAVGEPVTMRITVKDGRDIAEPILPASADFKFEALPGRQSMSSTQWINGVLSSESTTTLSVLVTPLAQGILSVPPISIMVDGIEHRSPAVPISVGKSDADTLLQVVVTADSARTYVGQPLDLILRIAVRPYRSREHDVILPESDMWGLIDGDRSEWGIFAKTMRELAQRGQRPAGREELLDGAAWYVYEIKCRTWPTRAGVPDIGDVRIQWRYPTGLVAQRGIFGGRELALAGTRLISAKATAEGVDVLPLPAEGRPEGFAGAVGDFSVRAEARPVKAAVGDPITLTVQITDRSGEADMDSLPPPPLGPGALGPDFRIPEAPLAGTVSGQTKTFTQTIRPTRDGLESIPAVTYSWFDPQARTYRSASTEPIAISVAPSERISTDAILGSLAASSASWPARDRALTPTAGGVPASIAVTHAVVADRRAAVPAALAVSLAAVPPLACAAAALAIRRKQRLDADPARARERTALRDALAAAREGDASAAISSYACARLHRPPGTLTARELRTALADAGAGEPLSKSVEALLEQAEKSRFAPAASGSAEAGRAEAQRVLGALDRLDWTRARRARSGGAR